MRFSGSRLRALCAASVFVAAAGLCVSARAAPATDAAKPATTPAVPPPAAPPASSPELQFGVSYLYAHWQAAEDFKRISEYFTGREATGGDIVARSDAGNRSGLYFRAGLPVGTRIPAHSIATLEYIRGDSPRPRSHTFELPEVKIGLFTEIRLGLTGRDWPDKKTTLVAWRFTLRDNTGAVLARRQSFLWEMGEDEAPSRAPWL